MIRRLASYLVLAALPTLAAAEPVRLGTEGAFAPFTYLEDGTLKGFEIELGQQICRLAQLDCEWVLSDWANIIPGLLEHRYDAILAGMAITPERQQLVSFSQSYDPNGSLGAYVGAFDNLAPETARIAVQGGTVHETHLRAKGITPLLFDTAGAALQAVLDGQADLVFGSPAFLEGQLNRAGRVLFVIGEEALQAGPVAIAFRKEDQALRQTFNHAIDTMRSDGTLAFLLQKWFGASAAI